MSNNPAKANIVFTGHAINCTGQAVTRSNLTKACELHGGLQVQKSVQRSTDLLVASRTDTVKARTARKRGLLVLSYPEFIRAFLGGIEIPVTGEIDRWVDAPASVTGRSVSNAQLELQDFL